MRNIELCVMFQLMQIENNKSGNLVPGQETINCPAGALFIRGIQVYDSTHLCLQELTFG